MKPFFQRLGSPWGRRSLLAAGLAGLLGLAACAPMGGHGGGSHSGPMMGFGGHGMHRGPMDPAKMDERIERMADRLIRELDGTPEQRAQIAMIAKAAAKDMAPWGEQARFARKQATELLKAPTLDKAAIETLRMQQMALADSASKRTTQALTEIAEVLTPDQRAKAARWLESRDARRRS